MVSPRRVGVEHRLNGAQLPLPLRHLGHLAWPPLDRQLHGRLLRNWIWDLRTGAVGEEEYKRPRQARQRHGRLLRNWTSERLHIGAEGEEEPSLVLRSRALEQELHQEQELWIRTSASTTNISRVSRERTSEVK